MGRAAGSLPATTEAARRRGAHAGPQGEPPGARRGRADLRRRRRRPRGPALRAAPVRCRRSPGERRSVGSQLEFAYGLEGLVGADTVIVDAVERRRAPPPEVLEALRAAHTPRRADGVVLHRGVRARRGRPPRRAPRDHALAGHRGARPSPSVGARRSPGPLRRRRRRAHVRRCGGEHRPRPAHRAASTSAPTSPTASPAGPWCHRIATGDRRSTSRCPCPTPGADAFSDTLEWILDHIDEPLRVADLAERAHMSPRTFARHFRAVTGLDAPPVGAAPAGAPRAGAPGDDRRADRAHRARLRVRRRLGACGFASTGLWGRRPRRTAGRSGRGRAGHGAQGRRRSSVTTLP